MCHLFRAGLCLLAFAGALVAGEAAGDGSRRLLILHSYHPDDWTDGIMTGIREVLGDHPGITWSVEYMYTKQIDTPAYLDQLCDLYRAKYRNQRWDALLTSDDHAWHFALTHRAELFGGSPLVFCGVNRYRPADHAGQAAVTGVVEQLDLAETLAVARRCRPLAKRIWIITDDTETAIGNRTALERTLATSRPELGLEILSGLPVTELARRLAAAPREDFAFCISYWHDDQGQVVPPAELGRILARSAIPVFTRSEWLIGHHTVGGRCVSGRAQGAAAAGLVRRILDGTPPADLPVVTDSPNLWLFNHPELVRHGISPGLLPPDSTIVGRPSSVFEINRSVVWFTAGAAVVLLVLILHLVITGIRRRLAATHLARSEARYRRIADHCWDFICELDGDGGYRYCNAAYRQLGYEPTDLISASFTSLVHPDDAGQVLRQVLDLDPDRSRLDLTYRLLDAQGNARWFESTAAAYTDADGRPHFTVISRDIGNRLLSQADRERFFTASVDLLCITDFEGRFRQVNAAWTRTLGWSEKELLATPWLDLVHPDDREAATAANEVLRAGETVVGLENRYRCRDGGWRWLAWNSYPLVDEDRIYTTVHDITDRKRIDTELQESERRFRNIVQASPMGIHLYELCGDELVLIAANPAADRIISIDHNDYIGRTLLHAFPQLASTEIPTRYLAAAREGTPWHTTSLHYQDERISGAFDVFAFQTRPGQMAAMFLDITARLQAEQALRESRELLLQSQKMESIGLLAGGIAHDFNNMLGGIIAAGELLQRDLGPDGEGRHHLDAILQTAGRAADLTHQLLSFSRRGRLAAIPCDVHAAIAGALTILRHTLNRNIQVEERLAAVRSGTVGDPAQLQSAVLNLGVNARDAMPAGGTLTVATRDLDLTAADCVDDRAGLAPGPYLELTVADTGCGMTPAVQQRIFEPFFTTKDVGSGTGLGLAIVFGIVRDHGGSIEVASEKGAGTTFVVRLPVDR
jgi:PAS domain S-box-containing protein